MTLASRRAHWLPRHAAVLQAPDAPPALTGRTAGKMAVDQSSVRDTHAEADRTSPVKALMASPKPAAEAHACIWEKLASHEVGMSCFSFAWGLHSRVPI